jgi:hypothetical protein
MFKWATNRLRSRRSNKTQRGPIVQHGHIVQQGMHPDVYTRRSVPSNPYGYNGAMTGNTAPVRRTMLNRIRRGLGFGRSPPIVNPVPVTSLPVTSLPVTSHNPMSKYDPSQGLSNGVIDPGPSVEELIKQEENRHRKGQLSMERAIAKRNRELAHSSKLKGRVNSRANGSRANSKASSKGRSKQNNSPSILRMSELIKTVNEIAEPDTNPDEYAVNKLILVDQLALHSIFQELRDGPKVNHYMWWICPFFNEAGQSDPLNTYVTEKTYTKFLVNIDIEDWVKILNIIASPEEPEYPIISDPRDKSRIRRFCREWKTLKLKHWPQLEKVISKLENKYTEHIPQGRRPNVRKPQGSRSNGRKHIEL